MILVILSIIGCVTFLCFHRVFCLSRPKIKAKVTSRYLDHLPKDGVLVEGLIAYSVAFQSYRRRIVVIPHEPDEKEAIAQTKLSIKEFDLHYVVFSDLWKTELLAYPAINYIKTFSLIKIINEDKDRYYVYEIKNS